MYLRPAFVETDLDRIEALIRAHNFGLLVTSGATGMDASHLPIAVWRDGDGLILRGHLAAANPQCAAFEGGAALLIFSGPHAYISPSWYKTQPAVPTWDYSAVHVHGILEPEHAHEPMLDQMAEHDPGHFDVRDLAEKYREMMYKGIRSFRLRSTRIEAQWKMSQNRSIEDRLAVIGALRAEGNEAVALEIEATIPT
jgi:transcriptional regulator